MTWLGTCPVIATKGIESSLASASPVTRLSAGPGGGHDHAGLSRDSRVTFGREDPALLVPRQDGPDPVPESCQGLVHGHAGPAGVSKDHFDSVPYQRFDQNVGSGCRSRSDLSLAIVDGGHGAPRFPLQVHC